VAARYVATKDLSLPSPGTRKDFGDDGSCGWHNEDVPAGSDLSPDLVILLEHEAGMLDGLIASGAVVIERE